MELIQKTWDELGHSIKPLRRNLFIRTDKIPDKSPGGVFYPLSKTEFYEGPLHLRLQTGVILASGLETEPLKPGDRIAFQRKYYVRHKFLDDGTTVGWLRLNEVAGTVDPDLFLDRYLTFPEGDKAVRENPL